MARRKIEPPKVEIEVSERDFVMARIAAARALMRAADEALDGFITLCLDPDEDDTGEDRASLLEDALNQIGSATRALESAEQAMPQMDTEEIEPWEEEE